MVHSAIAEFWSWFLSRETKLRDYDPVEGKYELLRELGEQLRKIDPNLTFELGPAGIEKRELTISANGVRELIPLVEELLLQEPQLEFWNIVAFRQRKQLHGGILSVRDFRVSPADVLCTLSNSLRRVDINLYVDSYVPEDYYTWLEISFLLLDAAIGEVDVATKVGEVSIHDKSQAGDVEVFPLTELPERFDSFAEQLAATLSSLDNSTPDQRRSSILDEISARVQALAEKLDEDRSFAGEAVCLELYFRELDSQSGQALVDELRSERGMFVERVDLGGVQGGDRWIHCWFDQPRSILNTITDIIRELAECGYLNDCELEGAFVCPAEQGAMLDTLFATLDLVPGSQAAMYAHQEIESGNTDNAIAILEEALEEDPENLELRGLLAYSYAKSNDSVLAEECLDELFSDLEGDTENPATFWNIACAYALLQDAKRACESLSIAFELDPALREVAIMDPDLAPLKGQPDFDKLLYQA